MVVTEDRGPFQARSPRATPAYCSDGCRCALWETPADEPDTVDGSREHHSDPAVLSYAETCALFGGTQTGLRRLLDEAGTMRSRRDVVIRAHHDARSALNAYETFVTEGRHAHLVARCREAERARTERAAAAPPVWLRLCRWPAVLLIGAFDVWFFQQYFLDVGYTGTDQDPGWVHSAVALVPGIAVVFMILLSATMVGGLARGLTQGAGAGLARVVSGVVPLVYLAMVLTTVGYFAYLRAYKSLSTQEISVDSQVVLIAGLIGLLTLTSILMKIKGDDPEADAVFMARLRRRRSDRRHAKVRHAVTTALAKHAGAYSDLRAIRDEALSHFRDAMLEAYRRGILEPRAQHRPGTEVPPSVTLPPSLLGDAQANGSGPRGVAAREYARLLDDSLVDGAGPLLPEFEDIRQPRPSLGPLPEICRVLAVTDPGPLHEWCQRLDSHLVTDIARLSAVDGRS